MRENSNGWVTDANGSWHGGLDASVLVELVASDDRSRAAVATTLIGTTFTALGLLLQKLAHQPSAGEPSKSSVGDFSLRWWLLGLCSFVSGHVIRWVGMGLGVQMVLACFNAWSLVITFVLAPSLLGETVGLRRLLSAACVLVGLGILVLGHDLRSEPFGVEQLQRRLCDRDFQVATAAALLYFALLGLRAYRRRNQPPPSLSCMDLASVAAVIGWYCVLAAKCLSSFFLAAHLKASQELDSELRTWTYMLAAALLIFATLNVYFVNMALKYGEAVAVLPFYESWSILGQALFCGLFFHEQQTLTKSYCLGLAIILTGMGLLNTS